MRRSAGRLLSFAAVRVRRPAWPILAVLVGVAMATVLALANSAQATTTYKVTLRPTGVSGAVSLSGKTCATAVSTLDSESPSTRYTLGVAPAHFPSLTVTDLTFSTNATCTTLELHGSSTVLGKSVTVLVVGSWPTSTSTKPTFTVDIDFASVGLGTLLTTSGSNVGATFSQVWLGVTTASSGSSIPITATATTSALTVIRQFFTGFQGTTVSVTGSGVSFAGELESSGDLATGLSKLGVSNVQLTGKLTGSVGSFSTSKAPSASAGFTLTASFGLDIPNLPSWITFPSSTAFNLSISGTSSGNWSVTVTGNATVKLPPDTKTTSVTAIFSISKSTSVTATLSVEMHKLTDAFGLNWLTLTTTKLTWTVSQDTLTATVTAKITLGTAPTTVVLTAAISLSSATGATATLSLSTAGGTLSTTNLAGDLGLSLPTHTPTVELKDLDAFLKIPKSGSATVSVEANASLSTVGATAIPVSFLFRYDGTSLIVAAKTTTPFHLKTIDSTIPTFINVGLTHLAIVFATADDTLKSTTLDTPTKTFFKPLYCSSSSTTCTFTVSVKAGVTIQAAVALPATVKIAVCKLVVSSTSTCITGPITIDGHIPLFKSTTIGLTITLPTIKFPTGPVRRLKLGLSLEKSSSTFTVSASGKMVLLAPSSHVTGNTNCPTGVTPPSTKPTDICLTLQLKGSLKAGDSGLTLTFSAVVTAGTGGWRLPSPVTGLTIDRLAAQIGIKAGETGAGLTIGVAGTLALGTTTLRLALHVELTPEAPWVDLLGFKVQSVTGIGRDQIADLYDDVTGDHLDPTVLPPLALKDILLEYSATTDPTLGLCQGLHISADLVITNGHWTKGSYTAPTSVTCGTTHPTRSTACTANRSSCLASVLLTIGPDGFKGRGHLAGWSLGPLQVTPTTLDVTITTSAVQIHLSAGGTLRTPFTWPTEGDTAAVWLAGHITLTVGTKALHLYATGTIGNLHGSVRATGSLKTLEEPFSKLASFFTTTVKGALETAGNHIKAAMTTVGTTVKGWWTTYGATTGNQVASDIQNAFRFFGSTGPPTWVKIEAVFHTITSAISSWNDAVNKADLHFLDITASAIFNDVLHGIHINGWTVCLFGKCVTIIPGFTIPGVCSYVSTLTTTPLCTSSTLVTAAQDTYANPTVNSHLQGATLALPTGATDKNLVTKLHDVDPTGTTTLTCATATETYKNGNESDTTIQLDTLGNLVTIDGPNPTTFGNLNGNNQTLTDQTVGQNTLNSLYTGINQAPCASTTSTTTTKTPTLTMNLNKSSIDEGGSVTATGVAGTGITKVTITWGDGSTSVATLTTTSHTYTASHTYTDATGANGKKSPFTVMASATVTTGETTPLPVSAQVYVLVPAPQISPLTVTPSTIDVMQTVTVSGKLLNPEPQPATGTITWGDGTQPTTLTIASTGAFSASHVYERLDPTDAPQRTEPITVVLSRATASAQATSSVSVNDVAPTGLVSPTSGAVVTNGGTVFTHTGTAIGWTPEVTDVSPEQGFTFAFTWSDGTTNARATVTAPTPSTPSSQDTYSYPVALGSVSHTFAKACLYTVTITATDDDTLSTTLTTPVVVTAPLGFSPAPSGYWQRQFAVPPPKGGIASGTLACYLAIAQHLSPELGTLTPAAAESILKGSPAPTNPTARLMDQLRQELLTTLLNFANGSWNWTEPIGFNQQSLQTLVSRANRALAAGTRGAMLTSLVELELVGPTQRLNWSPSTNDLYSFATLNAGTAATKTFTITNPGPGGKLNPLPVVVTLSEVGSSAFTITADDCPTGPSPPHSSPRTRCTVTVEFAPTRSHTDYSAVLIVASGFPTPKGHPLPPVLGSLTLSGATS